MKISNRFTKKKNSFNSDEAKFLFEQMQIYISIELISECTSLEWNKKNSSLNNV